MLVLQYDKPDNEQNCNSLSWCPKQDNSQKTALFSSTHTQNAKNGTVLDLTFILPTKINATISQQIWYSALRLSA